MRLFGLDISWSRKDTTLTLDQFLQRLEAAYETAAGEAVTPENCMRSPTVHAIVTAISRRFAATPIHIYKKVARKGREVREHLPDHPVAKLLRWPNDWQTRADYLGDAASWLVRYGNHYAFKARGVTGPIRRLEPMLPYAVSPEQQDDMSVIYKVRLASGAQKEFELKDIHHVRGPARNGVKGDSPVMDVRDSIALEIAAENFAGSYFGNGAMPFSVFQYAAAAKGDKAQRDEFIKDFQDLYAGKKGRHKAMFLPKGIEMAKEPIAVDNEKNQFNETRKFVRTVIAGAFGIPPHMVGDLERGTFNNVEQQSLDFTQNVIQPYATMFEAAMERDLLTDADVAQGVVIRFNFDAILRGSFKERQEGLKIQREAGVINPNDWREREYMNPRTDPGGEQYWDQGPSGQGQGTKPNQPTKPNGTDNPEDPEDPAVSPSKGVH